MEKEFVHPFQICKASLVDRTGEIDILVRASSEKEDRVGETILKSAYANKDMRSEFEKCGYMDYNHLTDIIERHIRKNKDTISPVDLVALEEAKVKAIIGSILSSGFKDDFPSDYKIQDDGFYIKSRIFPENGFVKEIRKGLEAGWNGWGASVSGYARPEDKVGPVIKSIRLRKCALAPLDEVINQDTTVQLLKGAISLRDLEKSFAIVETEDLSGEDDFESIRDDFNELNRKFNCLTNLLSLDTELQDRLLSQVFSDASNRVKNNTLEVRSNSIREYLRNNFGFEGNQLEALTDQLFLNLNGG